MTSATARGGVCTIIAAGLSVFGPGVNDTARAMVMRRCKTVVALSLGMLLAAPAFAASQQDWDGCQSKDRFVAIPACSAIIPDESAPPQDRADAYTYRAAHYLAQGNFDRAIADYTEALKLTPRNVTAYVSRAVAEFRGGVK